MAELGTVAEVAQRVGGRVVGAGDVRLDAIAGVDEVGPTALTFATDERYLRSALESRAAAVLVAAALVDPAVSYAKPLVVVESPRVALATLLETLGPQRPRGPFRHPTAMIDPSARIGERVYLGAYVVIGAEAVVGDGTTLGAGVVIGAGVRIGHDCYLHPRAYVAEGCVLGERVILQAQAVIGSDGFGWAFLEGELRKIPQIGSVELGDDVEIGACSCIDRAQTGVTAIGRGTKIDNLVQIGHNCRVGRHTAIAAQTGLAGTTIIGDYAQIAGQVGFRGHMTVGSRVRIAGGSRVWGNVPDDVVISGDPARNHRDNVRAQAYIKRLPKLFERVEALERTGADLTGGR